MWAGAWELTRPSGMTTRSYDPAALLHPLILPRVLSPCPRVSSALAETEDRRWRKRRSWVMSSFPGSRLGRRQLGVGRVDIFCRI